LFNFIDAVKLFFLRWKDFSGRSSRSEFWWAQLAIVLMYILFIGSIVYTASAYGSNVLLGYLPVLLTSLLVIAAIIPTWAVTIRRLHDRNMSGWYCLLFNLCNTIPVINFVSIIAMIVIYCLPSTNGFNKFGPDPLGPESEGRNYLNQSGSTAKANPAVIKKIRTCSLATTIIQSYQLRYYLHIAAAQSGASAIKHPLKQLNIRAA